MKFGLFLTVILIFLNAPAFSADEDIKLKIIFQSIKSYDGPCPCPYSLKRNGNECGNISAYKRPGGAEPICYETDISEKMIENYKLIMNRKKEELEEKLEAISKEDLKIISEGFEREKLDEEKFEGDNEVLYNEELEEETSEKISKEKFKEDSEKTLETMPEENIEEIKLN